MSKKIAVFSKGLITNLEPYLVKDFSNEIDVIPHFNRFINQLWNYNRNIQIKFFMGIHVKQI